MRTRRLGPDLEVSAIGLGCMGMSHAYGGQEEAKSIDTLRRAVDIGITFFDTAEVYGPYTNEILLGKALKGLRDKVTIATKFGFEIGPDTGSSVDRMIGLDGRPETAVKVAEESLKRLGIEVIDLFYLHRVDPKVPVEESVGAMGDLVRQGKVRFVGVSEVDAVTLRRAHHEHPIAAVQSEYSLWTRGVEAEVLPAARALGIGFVPFSPLGRGFLAGSVTAATDLAEGDFRRRLPRFQEAALAANARFVAVLEEIAESHGATKAQLALAWVLAKGDDIVPIPGTRRIDRLEENAAAASVLLSAADVAAIEAAIPPEEITGERYGATAAFVPKK
ncbi:aldo/keto reductase [Siculibacillus lacustris]|uniref:Aldo/keto reductase n=1 Tax=Siculibacillus lacustris TaxID=1549641 RepID=A0A4Q9VFZ4_9HYPH|nr:aldo/keto reductase [Siculibacillus lacustris]TBW33774.1 aldo/keto reductase [Siculibacillus lacustris]